MTELERRALLGNKQAQYECTKNGMVLPCPICGRPQEIDFRIEKVHHEKSDCMFSTKFIELDDWNTRPAPPIGRCVECVYSRNVKPNGKGFNICPASGMEITDTDFCSYFEPKED